MAGDAYHIREAFRTEWLIPQSSTVSDFKRLSKNISYAVIAIALLVLCGWVLDLNLLKSIFPHWVSMKVNAAICILLLGTASLLSQGKQISPKKQLIATSFSAVVIIVTALTIIEYLLHVNIGIDQLLFQDTDYSIHSPFPGRMSLMASIAFLLLAISLPFVKRKPYLSQGLSILTAQIGLLAVVGYVFKVEPFQGLAAHTYMAFHTGVSILMLSLGLLFLNPDSGFISIAASGNSAGFLIRRLFPGMAISIVTARWLIAMGESAGRFSSYYAIGLFVTLVIVLIEVLIVMTALPISHHEYERRQAALKLSQSEARKSAVLEASLDAIITFDSSSRIIEWNSSAESIFGYTQPEVIGQQWGILFGSEAPKPLNGNDISSCLKADNGFILGKRFELLGIRKNGKKFPAELFIVPINVEQQRLFTSTIRDITEQREQEQALRDSELRFRTLADNIPNLVWMARSDGEIFWYNKRWYEYTGTTFEQMEGWGWQSIHDPDILPTVMNQWKSSIATGKGFEMVFPLKSKDGEYRPFLTRITPVMDDSGHVQKWFGTNTDIAKQVEFQKALQASEEKFRYLAESNIIGIAFWHTDGTVTEANEMFLNMLGYSREELMLGQVKWKECLHDEEHSLHDAQLQRAVAGEIIVPYEARLKSKNGKILDALVGYAMQQGSKDEGFSFVMDITKRKQTERELYQLKVSLEERVKSRTVELEALNKELETFSYSVSHDLRAPLRGIDGFSKVLSDDYNDKLDEKGRHYLYRIREGSQQMAQLIEGMLKLSRAAREQLKIEDNVNLSDIVTVIADELKQQQPKRKVTFKIRPDIIVSGDKQLLHSVMWNLLDNAWKYTSRHDTAEIEFGQNDQNGRIFYVKDNGAGFDMAFAGKLFNAFQRLHKDSEFSGTGIGLATVTRIIHRHGGTIWAESEVEKGTTFYFTLGDLSKQRERTERNLQTSSARFQA